MKFGLIGSSYTAVSNVIADEETINLYVETNETAGAQTQKSLIRTPGLKTFASFANGPERGSAWVEGRCFVVAREDLCEVFSNGTYNIIASVANDDQLVSIVASNIQLFIVSAGQAYCYTIATNTLLNVTADLAGTPMQAEYSDGYFIVCFRDSNKFQISDLLDGTTWPPLQVNEVSVFPENTSAIIVSQRQLWIFGTRHIQPYQNTGSDEIFDVIPGATIEKGCAATFGPCRVDNSIFWVDEDERGARMVWRANGYTPQRISTHAVEWALEQFVSIANLATYSYQEAGHLFWVVFIPGSTYSWVFDVAEGAWHKRAKWNPATAKYSPHASWNHIYCFGKHLVGDWNAGKLYEQSLNLWDDDGAVIRRLRRAPIIVNEMERIYHAQLIIDVPTGITPQPPFKDGDGNDRPAQLMLRWSNNRGSTWSNEHILNCGFAGEYKTRVIKYRLGESRYRVYEISMTDPVPWVIVDGYVELEGEA